MGTINYLIHPDDASVTDRRLYRMKALAAGISSSFENSIGTSDDVPGWKGAPNPQAKTNMVLAYLMQGKWPPSLDVKNLELSVVDLVAAPALDQWLTAALAVVGTAYSCFQAVAAPQLVNNKLAVFWGVHIETIPQPVSRLTIRRGGAVGNIIGQFDMEPLAVKDTLEGIFSEPVVIEPNEIFAIQVLCRILTGAAARVQLDNFVFERSGRTVAEGIWARCSLIQPISRMEEDKKNG